MLRVAPGLITSPAAESVPSVVTLTGFRISTSWGDVGGAPPSQLGPLLQGPLPPAVQMTTVSGPVPSTTSTTVGVFGFAPFGMSRVKGLPLSSKSCGIGLGSSNGGGVVELPPLLLLFRFAGLSVLNR